MSFDDRVTKLRNNSVFIQSFQPSDAGSWIVTAFNNIGRIARGQITLKIEEPLHQSLNKTAHKSNKESEGKLTSTSNALIPFEASIKSKEIRIPEDCKDDPSLAKCHLVVLSGACNHSVDISRICCRSCRMVGQIQ